jgi:two-component sensor histidine kinase
LNFAGLFQASLTNSLIYAAVASNKETIEVNVTKTNDNNRLLVKRRQAFIQQLLKALKRIVSNRVNVKQSESKKMHYPIEMMDYFAI